MPAKERILVLNVDRDNDIGEKTRIKGPIFGRDRVIDAATKMGLTDPEDSDFNALFQAVKVYDEMKKQYDVSVAVLTGDRNVGIHSDREISRQLDSVLQKFKARFVVFVTDGSQDEHVMPIIQSKVPILSVKRVVVRQAEELESTYFKIKDFIKDSMDDPKLSKLIFGLPAMILIIYALFGMEGWRAILGVIGVYLFIKGFNLDDYVIGSVNELRTSLTKRSLAFFSHIVAIIFIVLGSYWGYEASLEWTGMGIFELSAGFMASSVYFFFIAGATAWVGRSVSIKKRSWRRIMAVPVFGFAISLVIYNASELILNPQLSAFNFFLSLIFGFALLFLALLLEWKY